MRGGYCSIVFIMVLVIGVVILFLNVLLFVLLLFLMMIVIVILGLLVGVKVVNYVCGGRFLLCWVVLVLFVILIFVICARVLVFVLMMCFIMWVSWLVMFVSIVWFSCWGLVWLMMLRLGLRIVLMRYGDITMFLFVIFVLTMVICNGVMRMLYWLIAVWVLCGVFMLVGIWLGVMGFGLEVLEEGFVVGIFVVQ